MNKMSKKVAEIVNYSFYTAPSTDLNPTDGHKSFYGKAKVYEKEGVKVLRSYSTNVAAIKGEKFIKLWDGWSATTGRHINSFASAFLGFSKLGKGLWSRLEVGKEYPLDYLDCIDRKFVKA